MARRARYLTDNVENFFDRLVKAFETQLELSHHEQKEFSVYLMKREERFEIAALKEELSASGLNAINSFGPNDCHAISNAGPLRGMRCLR